MIRALYPLWRELALRWWRWALREIDPLHPDAPHAVRRINELERGHA